MNKVPSVTIAHRPAREMAILVDPPWAKALEDQLRDKHCASRRGFSKARIFKIHASIPREFPRLMAGALNTLRLKA